MKQVFNLLHKYSLVFLMLLTAGSIMAASPTREFSKTINKQFNVNANCTVGLDNKYGQIDIKTWDQNTVRISVKIIVNAKEESGAQAQFDRIAISFFNTANHVGATTEIEAKQSSWWNWSNDCDDFSINYEVFMPASANIEVDAKYCDVFVVAITGSAELAVKYGNFKVDVLGEDSAIELAYGNGSINRIRDLDLDLAYGNLDVGEASDINVDIRYGNLTVDHAGDIISESKYSNFKLGEIREFRNEGKYDNVEIASVEELVCETRYTSIKVGRLIRRVNLDMAYGSAKIENLIAGFDEATVSGSYTDFKFYLDPGVNCTMDLAGTYADVKVPSSANKTFDAQEGSSHEVRATMGSGGSSLLKARLRYGGIKVGQN